MFALKTKSHETIWGGKKLIAYSQDSCEKIGHLYSVNCNADESNQILTGKWKGRTLNQYFEENKRRFGLEEYAYFPLVVALVEAGDHLSIQVHPDDQAMKVLSRGNGRGKNESWFFIEPPINGEIYCGCLCRDLDKLKTAIASGRVEEVTDRLQVRAKDYVYVQAGTLHALAKGSLVYEIEENAGATYRFFDFHRKDKNGQERPLQIPEAFYSIRLKNKSSARHYGTNFIEEKRYRTRYYPDIQYYENTSRTLQVFTVLSGECDIEGVHVSTGTSIILEPGDELHLEPVEAMIAEPKRLNLQTVE